ncbi:hypothetical protein BTN49_3220 [Candidatus Enterovibrio escicola]|uniref:Uncharacterized protein n=1 Tax=Candidatus Enterovibrio escicola TaxID=1927127 RepID=A0A2A5SZA3_9GAMM|nr:hypothetical protein BTN49_3220 [Candidatus Enterovibrio escacola]
MLCIVVIQALLLSNVNVHISLVSDPVETFKLMLQDIPNLLWSVI